MSVSESKQVSRIVPDDPQQDPGEEESLSTDICLTLFDFSDICQNLKKKKALKNRSKSKSKDMLTFEACLKTIDAHINN